MSKKNFRDHHLLTLLEEYEKQTAPLDHFIHRYFKENKALGSKDRAAIAETAYSLIRWRGWLDWLCEKKPYTWEKRVEKLRLKSGEAAAGKDAPPHIAVSFPKELFDVIHACYGAEKTMELCRLCNSSAPITIRVNALKTTREELVKLWEGKYNSKNCLEAPLGIVLERRYNLTSTPEYKQGFFELQDEASQLVASLVEAQAGDWFMDYCAGAGGKSLAIAPAMENKGQIFLHDIRPWALAQAQQRMRRAGVTNAQLATGKEKLGTLTGKMDWVLVDAPCSGTGTLRRNPDMKWKFSGELVDRLLLQQREIFSEALSYLKKGGAIVYATCSLLKEENEEQVEFFLKTHGLKLKSAPFKSLPQEGGMDGFFGAVFQKIT